MADSISSAKTMRIDCLFIDGDSRAITLKNPKNNPTTEQFNELDSFMQAKNIIIGDRYGGRFGRIQKATVINKYTTTLDLTTT